MHQVNNLRRHAVGMSMLAHHVVLKPRVHLSPQVVLYKTHDVKSLLLHMHAEIVLSSATGLNKMVREPA